MITNYFICRKLTWRVKLWTGVHLIVVDEIMGPVEEDEDEISFVSQLC